VQPNVLKFIHGARVAKLDVLCHSAGLQNQLHVQQLQL
jgi:hypothetical protein